DHRDGFVPFPPEFAERYRADGYWTGQTLGELLRAAARTWPRRPAIHNERGTRSYAELDAAADRLAHGFGAHGIAPGDRGLVQLPDVVEFVPLLCGLLRAGAIPVLALPAHRRAEIEHLAELSGAVAYLIADRVGGFDCRELAAGVIERVDSVRRVFVLGEPGP